MICASDRCDRRRPWPDTSSGFFSALLTLIAEVAIALIAFSTIVVVLRQMVGGALTAFQVLVVQLFTVCGFAAVFLALLPALLAFLGLDGAMRWALANVVMLIVVVAIHVWYFWRRRRAAPERRWTLVNFINLLTLVIGVVLLALGALGIVYADSIAPYAFGLVGLLLAATTAFLGTLPAFLDAPGEDEK